MNNFVLFTNVNKIQIIRFKLNDTAKGDTEEETVIKPTGVLATQIVRFFSVTMTTILL